MKAIIGLRSLGGHNPGNGRIVIGASDFGLVVGLGQHGAASGQWPWTAKAQ